MSSIDKDYKEFKLDNGLTVALQETPSQTVAGALRVNHGALNEEKGEEGIAHFLEHAIVTGGSKKYSPQQTDEIRTNFSHKTFSTSLYKTAFEAGMLPENTEIFLDYISDTVLNPRLDRRELEQERSRILRETSDKKSKPNFKDNKALNEAFFGKDSPQTYFILGDEEVIKSANEEDLRNFHERGYHPNNMDLILVGALPDNIEDLVHKNFSNYPRGDVSELQIPRNPPLYEASFIHTSAPDLINKDNPDQSSAKLNINLFYPTITDEDIYAAGILSMILGGGSESMLFNTLSRKNSLAYSITSLFNKTDKNTGQLKIEANIDPAKSEEAIDLIFHEMNNLREQIVVPEKVLDGIKRDFKYQVATSYETNFGRLKAIESKLDNGLTVDQHFERAETVTPDQVREVAQKYLPESRANGKYALLLRDPLKD